MDAEPLSQPLTLPEGLSPDALDSLTELSSILSRLRTPTSLNAPSTTGATPAAAPTPSQHHSQLGGQASQSQSQGLSGAASTSTPAIAGGGVLGGDISLRDFPAATDALKLKMQSARRAVLALPDMDKTTADQEAEVAELEARIERQRQVLAMLREKGARFAAAKGEDRMDEGE
ncbi:RNA polymerase II transcription mediator complex subunit 9-domain-containing protein [Xylariales sp. PMI_506]|nr:RNA polymerase II transcription mediator complex subunit 9-domain-containing protein [Xylariales sp. PMI_506]